MFYDGLLLLFLFLLSERGSYVSQAGPELAIYPMMSPTFSSSYFHLQVVGSQVYVIIFGLCNAGG